MTTKETTKDKNAVPATIPPMIPEDMNAELDRLGKRLQKKTSGLPLYTKEITLPNGQKAIHCDDGPAVEWAPDEPHPEGKKEYIIRNVTCTEQIVMRPETLTIAQIKNEKNVELRRIMRERFGEGRYLQETGAKVIDADYEQTRKGAAPRVLLEDDEKQRFLVGTDGSTGRTYYMQVDSRIKTCSEAHQALSGFPENVILAKS